MHEINVILREHGIVGMQSVNDVFSFYSKEVRRLALVKLKNVIKHRCTLVYQRLCTFILYNMQYYFKVLCSKIRRRKRIKGNLYLTYGIWHLSTRLPAGIAREMNPVLSFQPNLFRKFICILTASRGGIPILYSLPVTTDVHATY